MSGNMLHLDVQRPEFPRRRECRVYPRYPCDLPTTCKPPSILGEGELTWNAQILNISRGGVGLLIRRRFEPGAILIIALPGQEPGTSHAVLARVVHATRQDKGWLVGCAFISNLSNEELEAIRQIGQDVPEDCYSYPPEVGE
jgi:hypothetical protein